MRYVVTRDVTPLNIVSVNIRDLAEREFFKLCAPGIDIPPRDVLGSVARARTGINNNRVIS